MHLINKKKQCVRNALVILQKRILLDNVSQDLAQSIELDKVYFVNGRLTNSISDSFKLLNSLYGTNFSHTMSYKSEHLTRREDISNAFNSFFAEDLNNVLHLVSKDASSKTVKLVEFLQSLNERLILNAIQKTKSSSAVFSSCFPSKNLHLCPKLFDSSFLSLFSSIISTCAFPPIWENFHKLIRCSSLDSEIILPTIGLLACYQKSR